MKEKTIQLSMMGLLLLRAGIAKWSNGDTNFLTLDLPLGYVLLFVTFQIKHLKVVETGGYRQW